jgi:hypothetical protein
MPASPSGNSCVTFVESCVAVLFFIMIHVHALFRRWISPQIQEVAAAKFHAHPGR